MPNSVELSPRVQTLHQLSNNADRVNAGISPQPNKIGEYAAILLVTAIWGSAFSVIKVALYTFTPWQLILVRFLPIVPIYAVVCWHARDRFRLLNRVDWLKLIIAGFSCTIFYNWALNTGQTRVGAGIASLVIALNPPTILILAVLLRGERVRRTFVYGMVVSFIGVSVLTISRQGFGIDQTTAGGIAFILLCPISWGTYTVLLADLVPKLGAFAAPAASVLIGSIMLLPSVPGAFPAGLPSGWVPWLCGLSLGLLSTVAGFSLWAWLLKRRGAARTGIAVYLNVVWGLLTACILVGEDLTIQMIIGTILIFTGVAVARRKPRINPAS